MKEKKTTEIATNKSSGAEKVEIVEKQVKAQDNGEQQAAKKTVEVQARVKKAEPSAKAAAEEKAAKARVDAALKKEKAKLSQKEAWEKAKAERREELAKLEAEQKARAEKRAAERKAKAEKHAAERKAMIEKRKAEKEARIRERAHTKANRSQAKSKANQNKKQNDNRENRKGYGGWLAAVISLGAVTLALTTAVTVGAINMKRTNESMLGGYRSNTYELIGIMENVENDLDRARVSASTAQQSRILTDLLVQARLAELDLEKMPVEAEKDRNLTSFVNRVAHESERMLAKLRNGEALNDKDREVLQNLYETNHSAREQLGEISQTMTDDMLMSYLKKGEGMLKEMIDKIENATLDENRLGGEKSGAGMRRNADAPPMGEENAQKIEPSKAEELCTKYFSAYNIGAFQCIGETVNHGYTAYNVQGYDQNGTLLFAEIDCASGALLRFDYYEDCNEEKFDLTNAQRIAETFLDTLDYKDMQAVRVRESGTDADFTFVYEHKGVAYYPDTVHVKICRTRGVVTGFDATKYIRNHKDREEATAKLSLTEAQAKLHKELSVENARMVVVEAGRKERTAYEFLCAYGEEKYVIYTDANSGEEISIVNLKNLG